MLGGSLAMAKARTKTKSSVLRMRLVDANPAPQIRGREELAVKTNYFRGNDPKKWRTDIAQYARVEYEEVYPGVDLIYYGNQQRLEFDFAVAPGADPSLIRLAFKGARKIKVTPPARAPAGCFRRCP